MNVEVAPLRKMLYRFCFCMYLQVRETETLLPQKAGESHDDLDSSGDFVFPNEERTFDDEDDYEDNEGYDDMSGSGDSETIMNEVGEYLYL